MNLHLVTATLPPRICGIGDYTARIAAELARSAGVKVLTAQGGAYLPIPGVCIEPVFDVNRWRSFLQIIRTVQADRPDWLVLQYSGSNFGRYGLAPHVPWFMRALKQRCPNTRLAVMAHETFKPATNWKFAVITTWQRTQLWLLGRGADAVFFSIQPWVDQLSHWFPGRLVAHLPVGSNIPYLPVSRRQIRDRLEIAEDTVVLGLFGKACRSRMLYLVRDAAAAVRDSGRRVQVMYLGPHGEEIRSELGGIPLIDTGPLPAEEVSHHFAAIDISLAPFEDGVSTRRTTLMTALQHGVAVVGTRGRSTDRALVDECGRSLLLADVGRTTEFVDRVLDASRDDAFRARLGREGQRLYNRRFTWERVSSQLLAALAEPVPCLPAAGLAGERAVSSHAVVSRGRGNDTKN